MSGTRVAEGAGAPDRSFRSGLPADDPDTTIATIREFPARMGSR
ncbi:hypothetical protein [Amycolatopsis sp. NPDC004169]